MCRSPSTLMQRLSGVRGRASRLCIGQTWHNPFLRTRNSMQDKIEKIDVATAGKSAMQVFRFDHAALRDSPSSLKTLILQDWEDAQRPRERCFESNGPREVPTTISAQT